MEANKPGWLQSRTGYNQTIQALNSVRAVLQYILEPVIVNDYQLLMTNAILVCRQGGAIYFADNGQERAAANGAEQNPASFHNYYDDPGLEKTSGWEDGSTR